MREKTAIIIGAGPAGLTAAYELIQRTDIKPIILESTDMVGGIARTVNYKGNRIDIGGHRFFSKSDRVMNWWLNLLPLEANGHADFTIKYQGKQSHVSNPSTGRSPETSDEVMLIRSRKSRIYYLRKFFDYPLSPNWQTFTNLGPMRIAKIGASYLRSRAFPIRQEKTLEDFFINRFGRELFRTFFRSYTEKVWGVPCNQISAEWGAQRIKGLSITSAIKHALTKPFRKDGVQQKGTETSLIERFLYPKFGPGQMWEVCAEIVTAQGAELHFGTRVEAIHWEGDRIVAVTAVDANETKRFEGDYFFSTMPVQDLVRGMGSRVPANVQEVASGLVYRDFITVGLLTSRLRIREAAEQGRCSIKDNWIYIQEPDVRVGRLQIFNNWSPYMVADPDTVWLGLEYFCTQGDDLWESSDEELKRLAADELSRIGIIDPQDVIDATVLRMEKTYPAYFGTYNRFDEISDFVNRIENLYLIGRNGMHRYNNQDHSMLTAMTAVDNIIAGRSSKDNLWAVNTEMEYHEEIDSDGNSEEDVSKDCGNEAMVETGTA